MSSKGLSRRVVLSSLWVVPVLASTPAAARDIRVPYLAQKSASDCGRAILASLAARRGGKPETYYARLPEPKDPRGYSLTDMRRLGGRVGVSLSTAAPGGVVITGDCSQRPAVTRHMARLSGAVRSGRPVVVPIGQIGGGHYLILVGSDGSGFNALDPASPGTRRLGTEELANMMCSYGYLALIAA